MVWAGVMSDGKRAPLIFVEERYGTIQRCRLSAADSAPPFSASHSATADSAPADSAPADSATADSAPANSATADSAPASMTLI
ncbi:Hypothetical protein FKW44_019951 [Caligus rogercresseyi]|uniref:Uncharacterized protein n=1 Tax=Caligus rogercresseyi TaxID=217165 RepID=A0A7T8JXV6_CALRO|nr:Hypothetical protein FKW44_019951 [Caligus rogercresseyi]